jgi:hypothetical protein
MNSSIPKVSLRNRMRLSLLAFCRWLPPFRGKFRVFRLLGVTQESKDLVPEYVTSVRCIENIEAESAAN